MKIFFVFIFFIILSCNKEKNNKNINNIEIKKNHDIVFLKKEKSKYRQKNYIKPQFEAINKLFSKISKNVIVIKSNINFETFTNLPPLYKELFNKDELTFSLPGILIDDKHILSNYDILKLSNKIFIKNSDIELKIKGFDEDLNISILESNKRIEGNIVKIIPKKKFAGNNIFSIGVLTSKERIIKKGIINLIHYSELYETIDSYFSNSLSSVLNISFMVFDYDGDFIGIISNYDPYYKYSSYIVSTNMLVDAVKKLKKGYKTSSKSWIGLNFKKGDLIISKIIKDSPADKAKFKIKDKLISINGIKLKNIKHLKEILSFTKPESKITIRFKRKQTLITVILKTSYKPLN